MTTEAQKIMQAYREGVAFGKVVGGEDMRQAITDLFEQAMLPWSPQAEAFKDALAKVEAGKGLKVAA